MSTFRSLLVSVLVLGAAGGCAKQSVVKPDAISTAPAPVAKQAPVTPPAPMQEAPAQDSLDAIARRTVLQFGFDDASLSPESQGKLQLLADALRKRPGAAVQVAGHCDERGTVEYNLALGQRRATAARKYLVSLGVSDASVDTVSFGSERPLVSGHDEAAWTQNRRAEAQPLKQ